MGGIVVSQAELNAFLGAYLWPFARIAAALGALPVLGTRLVPMRVRLVLAAALAAVIAPLVPAVPAVDPLSPAAVALLVQQILIGVAMGFALQLAFGAFVHAGQVIAMQMGLGFASLVDPQNGVVVPVLSQFYLILATLFFFGLDGHHVLIEVLSESFRILPIAPQGLSARALWELATAGGLLFAGALRIALPIVLALLAANLVFGVMMRAAPQLNVFVLGFPLSLLFGFVLMLMTLPGIAPQFDQLLAGGFELIGRLLSAAGGSHGGT
jgi:flagellar biosynthetic protein FliR